MLWERFVCIYVHHDDNDDHHEVGSAQGDQLAKLLQDEQKQAAQQGCLQSYFEKQVRIQLVLKIILHPCFGNSGKDAYTCLFLKIILHHLGTLRKTHALVVKNHITSYHCFGRSLEPYYLSFGK